MEIAFLAAACLSLLAGHSFKISRWKQMIAVYEPIGRKTLLRSLACGYFINFFVPFRIGDFARALISGRKMENGLAFSFATVIVDRVLDIIVVGIIFILLLASGITPFILIHSALFYILISILIAFLILLSVCFRTPIKRIAKIFCSIFNQQIELNLLVFLWSGITAVKDILKRLNRKRLIGNTLLMWGFYLISYYMMSMSLSLFGAERITFADVFSMLFGSGQIITATGSLSSSMSQNLSFIMAVYILAPLVILLLVSFLPKQLAHQFDKFSGKQVNVMSALHLLPQVSAQDKLKFLESYFEAKDRDFLNRYIAMNRDIRILQDFSAGSNATTMLCMNEQHTFYRKYAFDKDGIKLKEQLNWIDAHKDDIPLPAILNRQIDHGYCCYDMSYDSAAVGLFHYLHSTSTSQCWKLIEMALNDLSLHVHQKNMRKADLKTIEKYINEKITENVKKIEKSKEILPLLNFDTLIINGVEYQSLNSLSKWLNHKYLLTVFENDIYADIHGDLTVENIICWEKATDIPYYFIDPNTGNLHESPFLDYGKLLQSLHGGYEFMMRTDKVEVNGNQINFLFTRSQCYDEVFKRYKQYLEKQFSIEQVRSIFFHEVVHWLRLMPYKIEKNGKRATLFFAGLIIVFNDVVNWYGEIE